MKERVLKNIESADVTVAHTQEGQTHDIFTVFRALQDHMLFTPALAFIPRDDAADLGVGMVVPACADVLSIAVEDRTVLQPDERTLAISGIALTGGKKQDLLANFSHIYHLSVILQAAVQGVAYPGEIVFLLGVEHMVGVEHGQHQSDADHQTVKTEGQAEKVQAVAGVHFQTQAGECDGGVFHWSSS